MKTKGFLLKTYTNLLFFLLQLSFSTLPLLFAANLWSHFGRNACFFTENPSFQNNFQCFFFFIFSHVFFFSFSSHFSRVFFFFFLFFCVIFLFSDCRVQGKIKFFNPCGYGFIVFHHNSKDCEAYFKPAHLLSNKSEIRQNVSVTFVPVTTGQFGSGWKATEIRAAATTLSAPAKRLPSTFADFDFLKEHLPTALRSYDFVLAHGLPGRIGEIAKALSTCINLLAADSHMDQIFILYVKVAKCTGKPPMTALSEIDSFNTQDLRATVKRWCGAAANALGAHELHKLTWTLLHSLLKVHACFCRVDTLPEVDPLLVVPSFVPDHEHRKLECEKLAYIFGWAVWSVASKSAAQSSQHMLLWAFVQNELQTMDPIRLVKRTRVVLFDFALEFFYSMESLSSELLSVAQKQPCYAIKWTKVALLSNKHLRHRFQHASDQALQRIALTMPDDELDLAFVAIVSKYLRSKQKTWRSMKGWLPKSEASQRAALRGQKRASDDS
jgi:hypothetical protein